MPAPTYGDRVQETFTTIGTGTISLGGAVIGYQPFSSVVPNNGVCYYGATDGTNWEVGIGTYTAAGDTLTRTTILSSSNAGSPVNWAAGTKSIWLDLPAAAILIPDGTSIISAAGVISTNSSPITDSLSGDVSLSSTSSFFDGPSIAQGTSGTWFVSGNVTISGGVANDIIIAKLWDGTTVIDSTQIDLTTDGANIHLSGFLASPVANLKISVKNATHTTSNIKANVSGAGKDSTISAIRVA